MRPYIELYIDGQPVKFTDPPRVLITYAHTDLHNPTVVKNSFSKTITVDGTPENNRIFGCFYDMTKITAYDEISVSGGHFNPSKKVPFVLYRNGEPMEEGYVKLDKVTKTGNKIQYSITLFGGLGEFLYNLQYKEDGEQMKLSDLDYGGGDKEFNIDINKETVKAAWQYITGMKTDIDTDLYEKINFAPCYNGIPEDFSADKVAIDVESFKNSDEDLYNSFITSKDGYTTVDGWLLAELEKEYDEWETQDLRSYLQRPVIRFKEIVRACCNPKNNGGYNVALDEEFFNTDNPYYENAWMTLPLLNDLEDVEGDVAEYAHLKVDGDKITIANIVNGTKLKTITIPMTMCANASADGVSNLYTGVQITLNPSKNTWVESYNACRYVQLVVYDGNNNVVGGSNVYSFYTDIKNAVDFAYKPTFETTINKITGHYVKDPNSDLYVFNAAFYDLTINNIEWKSDYYMKLVVKSDEIKNYEIGWYRPDYPENEKMHNNLGINFLYKRNEYHKWEETVKNVNFSSIIDSNIFKILSAPNDVRKITKKKLLNSENTPCDYFLSYIKMFNLHIWKDMYEKTIYVKKRQNFFTNEIKDLEDFVDRGKATTITPLTFENKWLVMANDGVESGIFKDYKDEYGLDYGIQKMDTNYNFDNSSKNIFEKSVFKSAIQNRGKSKYNVALRYNETDSSYDVPPYYLDGFKTYLFNGEGDTTEGSTITPKTAVISRPLWKEMYYDFMPKPCFKEKDGKTIDGANVMLFYAGKMLTEDGSGHTLNYKITDDIPQFETLNEGEPCWIWTYDWQLATDTTIGGSPYYGDGYIPNFSRYLVNENNWITHSWDFGTPKALYVTDYNIDESSSIYTQYWKPYIRDMYSVDTRVVENNVLLLERVIGDWLRRFYYFDGSYWLLNKITDYDVTSDETTKCEFIRVNNIQNYLN